MTAPLQSFQLSFDGDTRGGFVAESFGTNKVEVVGDRDEHGVLKGFAVQGNNRLFAVRDYVWAHKWSDVNYRKLDLLGTTSSPQWRKTVVARGAGAQERAGERRARRRGTRQSRPQDPRRVAPRLRGTEDVVSW